MDIEQFMKSTNGQAVEVQEIRYGVPLDYVGEKLARAVLVQHTLVAELMELRRAHPDTRKQFKDALDMARKSFERAINALLGLLNMLDYMNQDNAVERLLKMSESNFVKWINTIMEGGGVRGLAPTHLY